MKLHRQLIVFFAIFLIISLIFGACAPAAKTIKATSNSLDISILETIPEAFVGKRYNLATVVSEAEHVEYSYSASYIDPISGESKQLKVSRGKLTPKAEADITVTVTAVDGDRTAQKQFILPIAKTVDIIDKLLYEQKLSEENVTKNLTRDSDFLHGEDSCTSLEIFFSTPTEETAGTPLLHLSHYSLQAYYSAQVWHNAAVSFWVYNPMEQEISFKLEIFDPESDLALSWGSTENTQLQVAEPKKWSNLTFSLYDLGIQTPLVDSPSDNQISLQLLGRYAGSEQCHLYLDVLDIVCADSIEGMTTGYTKAPAPSGNYSDLLSTCKVYTKNPDSKLTTSSKGNGTNTAYHFSARDTAGYPTLCMDLPKTTDISGFDYLKLDVYAENVHPWISVAIHYLDENGQVQKHGTSYDFYQNQWRTVYVNLDYLQQADLTKVVGFSITVNFDTNFTSGGGLYFDNVSLYTYNEDEPQIAPATKEDNDIISGPFYTNNTKPNYNGICKVATDETGNARSNSTLLFWANNASGYPSATFMFDGEQDWSEYSMLNFDTHQAGAHFWMRFEILYLDDDGAQKVLTWYHDAMFSHWQTTSAALSWFAEKNGTPQAEALQRVVGFRITADLFVHVTDEVGLIFFDNFYLS